MPKPRIRIRTVGRLYHLPPLPPLLPPFAMFFIGRPAAVRVSVNGGAPEFARLDSRPLPPHL